MEKVKVVKAIPGILNVGDTLVSVMNGSDFLLEEGLDYKYGTNERFVSLDYITVSESIPEFFEFVFEEDSECLQCGSCGDCDCPAVSADELRELDIELPSNIEKYDFEIQARYNFFQEQFKNAAQGSEQAVVYQNLMWFIDWLYGKADLI